MADDFMKVISNNAILTSYIPGYLNQAIHFTGDDMGSDKAMMIVLLICCYSYYGICICSYN